jgi:ComF family protein
MQIDTELEVCENCVSKIPFYTHDYLMDGACAADSRGNNASGSAVWDSVYTTDRGGNNASGSTVWDSVYTTDSRGNNASGSAVWDGVYTIDNCGNNAGGSAVWDGVYTTDSCGNNAGGVVGDGVLDVPHSTGRDRCDKVICALKYTDIVKTAMMRFKFSQKPEFGRALGAILAAKISRVLKAEETFDMVAAMPLSVERQKERGYDQVDILAGYVAMHLGIEYKAGVFEKKRGAMRQSGLSKAERNRNAINSFSVSAKAAERIEGCSILLIDDISTTLSTINAGAALLKENGATYVVGAVVASGLA